MKKLVILLVLAFFVVPISRWYLHTQFNAIIPITAPAMVIVHRHPSVSEVVHIPEVPQVVSSSTTISSTPKATKKVAPKVVLKKVVSNPKPVQRTVIDTNVDAVTLLEQLVIVKTNTERVKKGLKALSVDTKLAVIARGHSTDMLKKSYFKHESLNGCSPGCRIDNAGYGWKSYGENIQWMGDYHLTSEEMAEKIVADWMASTVHRENLLNSDFTNIGVGIYARGDKYYTTAEYSLPQ